MEMFPVFREYGIDSSTASSVNEARLAFEEMGSPLMPILHPVYR